MTWDVRACLFDGSCVCPGPDGGSEDRELRCLRRRLPKERADLLSVSAGEGVALVTSGFLDKEERIGLSFRPLAMDATDAVTSSGERELRHMRARLRRNMWLACAVLLLVAAATREPAILAGVVLGELLGWANYRWLDASTRMLLTSIGASGRVSRRAIVLFSLRALVIWGAIGLVFWSRTVHILAVVVGFCAFVLAVMIEVGYRIGLILLGREE